mmetsp:Transcript_35579/g.92951  ORF Transcript_35579/g.92951 Transcript_35579/m.92951 type:complete len:186 (-) Transcript_35579:1472-2029(-)
MPARAPAASAPPRGVQSVRPSFNFGRRLRKKPRICLAAPGAAHGAPETSGPSRAHGQRAPGIHEGAPDAAKTLCNVGAWLGGAAAADATPGSGKWLAEMLTLVLGGCWAAAAATPGGLVGAGGMYSASSGVSHHLEPAPPSGAAAGGLVCGAAGALGAAHGFSASACTGASCGSDVCMPRRACSC